MISLFEQANQDIDASLAAYIASVKLTQEAKELAMIARRQELIAWDLAVEARTYQQNYARKALLFEKGALQC